MRTEKLEYKYFLKSKIYLDKRQTDQQAQGVPIGKLPTITHKASIKPSNSSKLTTQPQRKTSIIQKCQCPKHKNKAHAAERDQKMTQQTRIQTPHIRFMMSRRLQTPLCNISNRTTNRNSCRAHGAATLREQDTQLLDK